MKVFVVPSWYPSADHPINGIFIQEQVKALAALYPQHTFGVSLWGQQDERLLLWSNKPLDSLKKMVAGKGSSKEEEHIKPNLLELRNPVFTWTRRILRGNMAGIIHANEQNFLKFRQEKGNIDVIHAHVAYPAGWIAMHLARKYQVPYVVTEHQGPFPLPSLKKNGQIIPEAYDSLKFADRVVAVGKDLQKSITQLLKREVDHIPNMVDEDFFAPKEGQAQEGFTFFSLGRITEMKGVNTLLQAIFRQKEILKEQKVRFRIGGEGEEIQKFRKMSADLGVESLVEWLGRLERSKVVQEFQNCNAFVLASRHESFGMVYAEALACGKPVIATRCGGPEDFITEETGILVPVNDEAALSEAIIQLVENPFCFDSGRIREYFLENFSKRVVSDKIISIYKSIL